MLSAGVGKPFLEGQGRWPDPTERWVDHRILSSRSPIHRGEPAASARLSGGRLSLQWPALPPDLLDDPKIAFRDNGNTRRGQALPPIKERDKLAVPHKTDLNLTGKDVAQLTSADALAGFFTRLGYDTGSRAMLTPEAIGLAAGAVGPIKHIELLSEDPEGLFLRVVFAQLATLTAKTRNDLVRVLGRTNIDHLLVLASDFEILEFVLLDKQRGERRGVAAAPRVQVVPRTFAVDRRAPDRLQVKSLRRLTWTCRDGLEQYEKLRTVFEAAAFTEEHFQNRALFADHYLKDRLPEQSAWQDNPSEIFHNVKPLLHDFHHRLSGKGEQVARDAVPLPELSGGPGPPHSRSRTRPAIPSPAVADGLSCRQRVTAQRWAPKGAPSPGGLVPTSTFPGESF